ncbi:MAG TPA: phosphoenolpyruvate synthase [Burkholderiales bacterium]|nr:phosphoenolpyruvate synthase [Burkholderiales bacterium]
MLRDKNYIRFFEEIGIGDVPLVGGKNASLGEMYRELTPHGLHIPNGFATTAKAYRYVLDRADSWRALREILSGLNPADIEDLAQRAARARDTIYSASLPSDLADEVLRAYAQLVKQYGSELSVAVRSSATSEDLPTASFAGQHESFLNVRGEKQLLDACRRCFASLFTDRAIRYRIDHGFDHFKVLMSVGIMKMVRADLAASGVMFTLDTESGFRNVVLINAAYGLGENVVQGAVDPDEFYIFKPTMRAGYRTVLRRMLGKKEFRMVYASGGTNGTTRNVPVSPEERGCFCISDKEVVELAEAAIKVEEHYSTRAAAPMPLDLEWAKDGVDGLLYIIQARPETVISRRTTGVLEEYRLDGKGKVKCTGRAVGESIATGTARVIQSIEQLPEFCDGEILVAKTTAPDWGTVMKKAAAIVTSHGGRTCHAAIVARELGIPAIVGAEGATERIRTGENITVSCAEGDVGKVYDGTIPFEKSRIDPGAMPQPKTHVMVNLGNPELAFRTSFLPNDGVGLARMEFIIIEYIKAHPMALAHPERVTNAKERAALEALAAGHASPADYFVDKLSEGVGTIAAAFYPKPVIVRLSDFKSNEYASLLGGKWFEPAEENPMLGFRGASRYAHAAYADGFILECRAMQKVRSAMGLRNIRLMIPFCRRIDEAKRVLAMMAEHGLKRGEDGLEIYVMCEIPNNVILIDQFAALFDGFSIGSNDLTQLTLGVDRDSEIVSFDFDERDEGVLEMIRLTVTGCKRNHRHCGICGQAPSDYPEVTEFLVKLGIDSISVNPDVLIKTRRLVYEIEQSQQNVATMRPAS